MTRKNDLTTIEVLSPVSEVDINHDNARRFDTLNGKTICEVWATGHYSADRTFPIIRKILRKKYTDINIIPYTEFEIGKPEISQRWGPLDKVADILKAKNCDAVLLGNGG